MTVLYVTYVFTRSDGSHGDGWIAFTRDAPKTLEDVHRIKNDILQSEGFQDVVVKWWTILPGHVAQSD